MTIFTRLCFVTILLTAVWFSPQTFAMTERWYTEEQLKPGESVYRENCLVCHMEAGTGTENWKERDSAGKLPPPPLNGTAHTWHHDLKVLARTILEGGAKLGGSMPGFKGRLSAGEIAAVIAYVQSLWPEEVYGRWAKAFPEDAARGIPLSAASTAEKSTEEHAITSKLSRLFPPEAVIGEPESSCIFRPKVNTDSG